MERSSFLFNFGTAEFDEARFELRVAGLPVEVERRVLEVLDYLLRHAGEVVTKEELFREVWAGRVTVDKVLPNAVNKLRRALGEANADYVTTVSRIGYRLDGPVTRTAVGRVLASSLQLSRGQNAPERPNFELQQQLGHADGGEVWLAEHRKTREKRVYKFALDGDRMRALKREVTLLRVLHESLDHTENFVELLDWNFSISPYFLECKYGGQPLSQWAKEQLSNLGTAQRIELFLQIADAVAAAHSVGVLHKDLKPSNVLVSGDAAKHHVRLTDFGSGHMLEPDNLAQLGITRMGMTVENRDLTDSVSGTPIYLAPELFAGQAPTLKSDVFALGILLYQLLSGRIDQPMVSGWENEITDPLLREDLKLASAGDPTQRLTSVSELTTRLRRLEARTEEARRAEAIRAEIEADKQRLTLVRARKPYLTGLIAVLVAGVCIAAWLANSAIQSRKRAELAVAEAKAVNDFLTQDLISRTNPAIMAKGSSVLLKDALLDAQTQISARFSAQPTVQASVHKSLAELFSAIDLEPQAEAEARAALAIYGKAGTENSLEAQSVQSTLAVLLARKSDFAKSDEIVNSLARSMSHQNITDEQRYLLSYTRALILFNKGAYKDALPHYALAMESLARAQPDNVGMMNSIRRDQIHAQTVAALYVEAEANAKSFLQELASRPGDQSLWIALVKRSVARSIGYQGRPDEAIRMLLDAEPIIEERFGQKSMQYLSLQTELLAVTTRKGDFPKALSVAEKLYLAVREQYGAEHPQTAKAILTWAFVAHEAEQDEKAHELLSVACAGLEKRLGAKAALTQNCLLQFTLAHLAGGRMVEAEALLKRLDLEVLGSSRTIEGQSGADLKRQIEDVRNGAQGLIDLSKGDPSGRDKVVAALRVLESRRGLKDRYYRILKAAEAASR